jgi:hypothetical protein
MNHPVTEKYIKHCLERKAYVEEILLNSAGKDSIGDSVNRGYRAAILDLINVEFEDLDD